MRSKTTISVPKEVVGRLEKLKVHKRQPLYEVIEKLLDEHKD